MGLKGLRTLIRLMIFFLICGSFFAVRETSQPQTVKAAPLSISVGGCGVVNVSIGVKVRSCAGTGCTQVGSLAQGTLVRFTGGPASADGYTWWQHDHGGWSVDSFSDASCGGSAPGRPSLSGPGNGSRIPQNQNVNLSWNSVSGATQYKLELWGGPYSTMTLCDWQSGTSCYNSTFWQGTMSWHVKARNGTGESDWSDTWSFTITPVPVNSLNGSRTSCGNVRLSWSDPGGDKDGYNVYKNGSRIGQTSSTSYDAGGSDSASYYIRTYKGGTEADQGNTVSVGGGTCPSQPTNPNPAENTTLARSSSITLYWSTNGSACDITVTGPENASASNASCSSYSFGNRRGGQYTWKVTSKIGGDSSGGPDWHFKVRPYGPTGLNGAAASATQINLTWTKSADDPGYIAGYTVYRNGASIATPAAGSTGYNATGLTCGTTYSFYVTSNVSGIESDQGSTVNVATSPCAPQPPTNLTAQAASSSEIDLNWSLSPDDATLTRYNIYMDGSPLTTVNPGTNHYRVTGLACGSAHTFILEAERGTLKSTQTTPAQATTSDCCYTLSTAVTPASAGTVTPNPAPNCENGAKYTAGTLVQLTASAAGGATFSNWSGSLEGTENPASLTMTEDKSVTAHFGGVNLSLAPSTTAVSNGQVFTMTISAAAGSFQVDTADVMLTFDPAYLRVVDAAGAETNTITPGTVLTTVLANTADNTLGQVNFSAGILTGSPATGTFTIATIRLKAVQPGTTAVSFLATTDVFWQGNSILGEAAGQGVDIAAEDPTPGAFGKLQPGNPTSGAATTLSLSWEPSAKASAYQYCVSTTQNACSGAWADAGQATSAQVSGLSSSTTYYWQVRAVNQGIETYANSGAWWTFTTAGACAPAWQAVITAEDHGGISLPLTIGQSASATDGLDAACGEQLLPPLPPSGSFDARLSLPGGTLDSLIDFRPASLSQASWTMKFQAGAGGFPFIFRWTPSALPSGSVRLKDAFGGVVVNVDMKAQSSYTLTNSAVTTLIIEYSQLTCTQITTSPGWNMLAIPTAAADMRLTSLFPEATVPAYRYHNAYQSVAAGDSLQPGTGYWVHFAAGHTYSICGSTAASQDIAVQAGWSLVGGFDQSQPVASITSTPAGILVMPVYGFASSYTSATTLQPGRGYWVYASQAGTLHLNAGSSNSAPHEAAPARAGDFILPVTIGGPGSEAVLEIGVMSDAPLGWLAPPPAPAGVLDARLTRDGVEYLRDIRPAGQAAYEYLVTLAPAGAGDPITVRWDAEAARALGRLEIIDRVTGNVVPASGSLEIGPGSPLSHGFLIRLTLPARFKLYAPLTTR